VLPGITKQYGVNIIIQSVCVKLSLKFENGLGRLYIDVFLKVLICSDGFNILHPPFDFQLVIFL
jgi:hypothetical protein